MHHISKHTTVHVHHVPKRGKNTTVTSESFSVFLIDRVNVFSSHVTCSFFSQCSLISLILISNLRTDINLQHFFLSSHVHFFFFHSFDSPKCFQHCNSKEVCTQLKIVHGCIVQWELKREWNVRNTLNGRTNKSSRERSWDGFENARLANRKSRRKNDWA